MIIGLEQYASYSKEFLENLAAALNVPKSVLHDDEIRIATGLAETIGSIPIDEINQKRLEDSAKQVRRSKASNLERLTTTYTGTIATLAPSLDKQGIGSMFHGKARVPPSTAAALLGAVNESTIAVGTMFGLYGGRVGSKTMETLAKEVQDFGLISLRGDSDWELLDAKDVPAQNRRLRTCFAVSGWITDVPAPFAKPWKVFGDRNENYTLQWEIDALAKMGLALETVMRSKAWSLARKDIISKDGMSPFVPVVSISSVNIANEMVNSQCLPVCENPFGQQVSSRSAKLSRTLGQLAWSEQRKLGRYSPRL